MGSRRPAWPLLNRGQEGGAAPWRTCLRDCGSPRAWTWVREGGLGTRCALLPLEAAPLGSLWGSAEPHRPSFPGSGDPPLPACPAPRSMRPRGLQGPRELRQRPLLHLLLLLWLLLRPVTRAQTAPGAPSAPTAPGTPRAPSLPERARALMRDFPLVDGCVGRCGGWWGPGRSLSGEGRPEQAELLRRLPHTTPGCPLPSSMGALSLLCHPRPWWEPLAQASVGLSVTSCVRVRDGGAWDSPGQATNVFCLILKAKEPNHLP